MITFHYPLLCHREYQLKQTKLFWCLWSISAGWMSAGMLLTFLWMSSNVHCNFIWEVGAHKVPLLIPNVMLGGGDFSRAEWLIDFGELAIIDCMQKAVNRDKLLLFAYTCRRLLCSSWDNAGNLSHNTDCGEEEKKALREQSTADRSSWGGEEVNLS